MDRIALTCPVAGQPPDNDSPAALQAGITVRPAPQALFHSVGKNAKNHIEQNESGLGLIAPPAIYHASSLIL
jgi:hypothetical protein